MIDINLACRTCMKSNVALVHLDDPVSVENRNIQLVVLLLECAAVQVMKDDGLPQNLCEDCIKVLQITYTFRSQAAKAEEQFKILLQEKFKQEIKDEEDQDFEAYDNFSFDDENLKLEPDENDNKEINNKSEPDDNDNNEINNKSDKEPYTCPTCSKTFTKEKKYQKHLQLHRTQLKCTYCRKKFTKESSLQKHLLKHDPNKCRICCETFADESELFQHIATHNVATIKDEQVDQIPASYPCDECGKNYTSSKSLILHQKTHKRKKLLSYTCDVCQKEFTTKAMVKRHLKLHGKEKPYKCTQCSRSYSRSDQLKLHMKSHSEDKSNVCSYCNKAFTQICSLKDHIRTHTGETPYLCSQCGRGFANSSNLRQHMLRHTGVKPHACKLCPKSFCTKGQMTAHMITHTGAHPHECVTCGAAFTKLTSLKKHAMIHTGQRPYGCETCLMRFTCKDHLKRHTRIHTGEKPYRCPHCERAFTQSNDLVKHIRGHVGDNIYECSVCNLRFRLKNELKKHYPVHFSDTSNKNQLNTTIDQTLQNDEQTENPSQPSIDTYKIDKHIDETFTIQSLIDKQIDLYSKPEENIQRDMNTQSCILPDILPDGGIEPKAPNKFMITVNPDGMIAINIAPEGRERMALCVRVQYFMKAQSVSSLPAITFS